ncbi:hypothetical protein NIA69_03545 [Gemmiger formicilis]|nr:hypothetical protein [Gemmiger formicilis]
MELLETYYGTMVAKNIEQLYHIHFKSIGCRPDIRRDMVLFSCNTSRAPCCVTKVTLRPFILTA